MTLAVVAEEEHWAEVAGCYGGASSRVRRWVLLEEIRGREMWDRNRRWQWSRQDKDLVEHRGDLGIEVVSGVRALQTWALGCLMGLFLQ
jgi:hypothetical protein